jgi:hypothetical protein
MADPISTNLASNTCGDTTSSNCVSWGGPMIPGLSICKGASITDVIMSLQSTCCSTSTSPGTGTWVDFSGSAANAYGTGNTSSFVNFSTVVQPPYGPFYKFQNGTLLFKGNVGLYITPKTASGEFKLVIGNIPPSSFPSGWDSLKIGLSSVTQLIGNTISIVCFLQVDYPSGDINIVGTFNNAVPNIQVPSAAFFDSIQFNF